jgi:hypothetical protein
MTKHADPQPGSKWLDQNRTKVWTILAVYNPNEEPDPWVKYSCDELELTCRLAAFLARFTEIVV